MKGQLSAKTKVDSHDDHSAKQCREWEQMEFSIYKFLEPYEVTKTVNHLVSRVVMTTPIFKGWIAYRQYRRCSVVARGALQNFAIGLLLPSSMPCYTYFGS